MIGLVQTVRDALDNGCFKSGGLNKKGCKVLLGGAPCPRVVVDFDKPESPLGPNETRCDYLFLAEGEGEEVGWVAPLELKSGRLNTDEVICQLQAGASAAEKLVPYRLQIRFRPIAVVGSVPKAERNRLRQKGGIRFHDCLEEVRLMSCGARLATTLKR